MRHGSLFTGIGGFDLAAQWMGWDNIFHVEKDKWCNKLLAKRFPHTKKYQDIYDFDATEYEPTIELISGGFPCQPFSNAGKRRGAEDDRHLWPQMLRVIRECKPVWVVAENVYGLLNTSNGMVFREVLSNLEAEGFEVQTVCIPACAVNAPHRRDRLWIIAYCDGNRFRKRAGETTSETKEEKRLFSEPNRLSLSQTITHSHGQHHEYSHLSECRTSKSELDCIPDARIPNWGQFPSQHPISGRNDGLSSRIHRYKALGNSIVPQVAYNIFQAIQRTQDLLN